MYRAQLKPKLRFKVEDKEYEIVKISNTGLVEVVDLKYNDTLQYKEKDLISLWAQEKLRFSVEGKNTKKAIGISTEYDFIDISENKHLEVAKFRYNVISPLINAKYRAFDDILDRVNEINSIIENNSQEKVFEVLECNYYSKISKASVYRWISDYQKANCDIRGLFPSHHKKGGKNNRRTDPIVIAYIEEVVEERYKKLNRINMSEVHQLVSDKIIEHNSYASRKVTKPSLSTVSRFIRNLPEYDLMCARYGKRTADNKFSMVGSGVVTTIPLERVEIDATPIDIILKIEGEENIAERPKLVAAIDKYSRMIVGFSICLGSVGWSEVMQCMRHIMMDKSYIKDKYPDIENEWNVFGIPKTLVIDNGKEFKNKAMKDAALQCGFELQYCPPRTPEWKASIERYFGTMNKNLIHNLPGTTRSNPQCLSEAENPVKMASIGFCTFLELVHKWIVDVYSQTYNKGLKGVPAKVWDKGVAEHRPAWPNDATELAILLGKVEERKITRRGIQLNNLYYNSIELNQLLHKLNENEIDVRVKVKYDPYDVSHVYVLDNFNNSRWLKIPSTNLEYTTDLTEMEHIEICKLTRDRLGTVDEIGLSRAKRYIYDKVDDNIEFVQKAKKKRVNSSSEILKDTDTKKFLKPLADEQGNGNNILSLGYYYNATIKNEAILISAKDTKEDIKTENTISGTKQKSAKDRNRKKEDDDNSKHKITINDENSLDDVDLNDFRII